VDASANLCELFLTPLERLNAAYFVTGSVASSAYGAPRFTQDLNLVLALLPTQIAAFLDAFPPSEFYRAPEESLREEFQRDMGGHSNLIHHQSGARADIYLAGDDPLHAWAFDHRRRIELLENLSAWLAPPEYVIVRKLECLEEGGGDRHISDIREMLRAMRDELDHEFIAVWAKRTRLTERWEELRRECEPSEIAGTHPESVSPGQPFITSPIPVANP
jgi:hypothetical protein